MCLLKSSFNWTFLGWNAPFCCTFMWTREKQAGWSFGLMVFILSNETIFGKFQMGLRIVWVMKPRERERNAPKLERRKVSDYGNYNQPMTQSACYCYGDKVAIDMEAWKGNLRT